MWKLFLCWFYYSFDGISIYICRSNNGEKKETFLSLKSDDLSGGQKKRMRLPLRKVQRWSIQRVPYSRSQCAWERRWVKRKCPIRWLNQQWPCSHWAGSFSPWDQPHHRHGRCHSELAIDFHCPIPVAHSHQSFRWHLVFLSYHFSFCQKFDLFFTFSFSFSLSLLNFIQKQN